MKKYKTYGGTTRFFMKDGVEYKYTQSVADYLCESNVFTKEEKEQIQKEVSHYPEFVESNRLIFSEWFWLINERIGN